MNAYATALQRIEQERNAADAQALHAAILANQDTIFPWCVDYNDPQRAGQRASSHKQPLDTDCRFLVYATHSRGRQCAWFVVDTLRVDEDGLPKVVRQGDSYRDVMRLQ